MQDNETRAAIDSGFEMSPTHHGGPMTYYRGTIEWDAAGLMMKYYFWCRCGFTCDVQTQQPGSPS